MYKRDYRLSALYAESAFSGVGILDPTTHNYCDLFANGVLKVVDEYCDNGNVLHSRVCNCKVHYTSQDRAYIVHTRRRYYLDEFLRSNF